MTTQAILSGDAKPSRSGALLVGLVALGIIGTSFSYGRSAHKAIEHDNAIAVANENHGFCVGLGIGFDTETYRKCMAGLNQIEVHQNERLEFESAGLL
jgi:hypothetical protein